MRSRTPILNHIVAALCGYIHLKRMRFDEFIGNAYQGRRDLDNEVVAAFISGFMADKPHFNPQFQPAVNA